MINLFMGEANDLSSSYDYSSLEEPMNKFIIHGCAFSTIFF